MVRQEETGEQTVTTDAVFADLVATEGGWGVSVLFEQVLTVMEVGEHGWDQPAQALFNPIDTEWRLPGSTNFNSAGVQDYLSLAQGVQATALTYNGWPLFLAAMASPNRTVYSVIGAVNLSDGVPGNYYAPYVQPVLARWPTIGQRLIAGTTATPPPAKKKRRGMVVILAGSKGPFWWADVFGKTVMSETDLHRADVGCFLPAERAVIGLCDK